MDKSHVGRYWYKKKRTITCTGDAKLSKTIKEHKAAASQSTKQPQHLVSSVTQNLVRLGCEPVSTFHSIFTPHN